MNTIERKSINTVERRHEIVHLTLEKGKVNVLELANKYQVSQVTIRADLNYLNSKNLLIRSRGGALACNTVLRELSIIEKHSDKLDVKKSLALIARNQINEGDAIILDSGTTIAELAKSLHAFKQLVVMTNGLNVAQNLLTSPSIEILMTGGILRTSSLSFYGRQAEESLERYHFDKAFIGVDGISFNSGITTHFEYEAMMNRLMRKAVKQLIAVTDSSKFNRTGVHKICEFSEIDILITDSRIPDTFAQTLEQNGVNLIIAN